MERLYIWRGYALHTPRERRSMERLYIWRGYALHTPRIVYFVSW